MQITSHNKIPTYLPQWKNEKLCIILNTDEDVEELHTYTGGRTNGTLANHFGK